MKHSSHYIERTLHYFFIFLFVISVLLLLADIDSFTAMASLKTAQMANSCEQTIPTSTKCGTYRQECSDLHSKQYVLNTQGETLCCCVPPPNIEMPQ